MLKKVPVAIIVATLVCSASLYAAKTTGEEAKVFTKTKTLTGGMSVEFSLVTLSKYQKDVDSVFNYTFEETEKIAKTFNESEGNDLSRIATQSGIEPVEVSKPVLVIVKHAKELADWTNGAFNPVDGGKYKDLKIDEKNSTIYLKKPGQSLNLHGILEGFIADLFIRAANHANLADAFVKVNSVTRTIGRAPYGPWQITVEGPGQERARHGMKVVIANYSAATVNNKDSNSPYYTVTVLTQQASMAQGIASSIIAMNETASENLINGLGIRAVLAFKDGNLKKIGKW